MLDTSFDKSFYWGDSTDLQYDTVPRDLMRGMQDSYNYSSEVGLYSAKYVEIDPGTGYKGWTNWTHKFQPDTRFGAISDKNAYLQQFPEVRSPWKFTEYIYKGIYSGTTIIEPPLYSPKTLTVINGVVNPDKNDPMFEYDRKCGRLRRAIKDGVIVETEAEEFYEPLYLYQTKYAKGTSQDIIDRMEPNPGSIYKQEDLEIGVTVDKVKYPKWTAPDAHPKYQNTFIKKGVYSFRKNFSYPKTNAGVRYYRKDVPVKCTDRGQHGNIPANVINMSAPDEWFDSSNLYTNVVIPRVTATFGVPMYAVDSGIISYEATTVGGDTRVYIEKVLDWQDLNILPSGVYVSPFAITDKIQQPRPNQIGKTSDVGGGLPASIRCVRNSDITDGEIVHKGCSFFKRDFSITETTACKCFIDEKPTGVFNVDLCQMYNVLHDESGKETKTPKQFYAEAGGLCPFYSPTGQREVITFETIASTQEQYTKAFSGISGTSGYFVNGDAAMAMSATPFPITAMMGGAFLSIKNNLDSLPTAPVAMGDMTVRYKVEYEFKKMLAEGRATKKDKFPSKSDYETVVEGTGKMAFDTQSTGYGGVDSDIFSGSNLLSRHRFNCSVMPCYNSEKCNRAYGIVNMNKSWENDKYAGVGGQDYCRYYSEGCPHTEVPRRALEYDKKYRQAMELIIETFRHYGIGGFDGIREYQIGNGVYAAVGNNESLSSLDYINMFPTAGDKLFFYYTISNTDTANHTKSLLFVHILQYNSSNSALMVTLDANNKPSGNYPDNIPWLVQLYDDYISPSKFETYIDNVRPFMGGRMPEYKDYSKMGEEVLCPQLTGGLGIFGREGNSGTDNKDDYSDNTKIYRGYRVDKTGEFIVDGRSLGGEVAVDSETRANGKPVIVSGATPIDGTLRTSMMTGSNSSGPSVSNAWVYSSDTRDIVNSSEMRNMTNTDGKPSPPKSPPEGLLPKERSYYLCSKCNVSTVGSLHMYNGVTLDKVNYWGEPVVQQIITDLEHIYFEGKCPRCGSVELLGPYLWTNFPQTEASGIVNVWGFPGQEVRLDGYYWKNHTEVSRSFISEVLTKLGPQKNAGGGYFLNKESSANQASEESVCLPHKQKGMNMKQGIVRDGKVDESTMLQYARNDKYVTEIKSKHQENDNRLTEGKYNDGQISPYDVKTDGLDFFTANHLKTLRNFVQPIFAYPLKEPDEGSDFFNKKQAGHKYRFDNLVPKNFNGKRKGVNPVVLASTETDGEGNYVQFWDGTVSPGRCVRYWYPPSKVWWYRYGYVGGIWRGGGKNGTHFDDSTSTNRAGGIDGYVGDVHSNAFYFPHGWIPLDKEVVRAIVSITPVGLPSAPAVGTVWSGVTFNSHYHPLTVAHEAVAQMFGDKHFDDNDINESGSPATTASTEKYEFSSESYVSYLYDKKYSFYENPPVSQFTDNSFGFNFSQDLLTWAGFGTDIVQNKTEAEAWKNKTYEDFETVVNRYTMNGKVAVGDPANGGQEFDISIVPPLFANGYYNNKVQYIPDYFDFTGMNDSLIYDRNGPTLEEKYYDSSWAESGQVIIQSGDSKRSSIYTDPVSYDSYTETGSGDIGGRRMSRFGHAISFDITDYFKKIYNKRNSRAFKVSTGLSFDNIGSYIINEKIKAYQNSTEEYAPNQLNNDRYGDATKGFWINNWNIYPKKNENGEFPTIITGEEYKKSPDDILDSSSGFYVPYNGVANKVPNSHYKDFSPLVLCMAKQQNNSITQKNGYVPSVSGNWSSGAWVSSDNSDKYWLYYSSLNEPSYFSLNLSGFPTEKERRPYRYEKGKWNVGNAKCSNVGNCRIANRGLTVSEAVEWAESPSAYGGFKIIRPSLDSIKCAECGTDLTKKPEVTGAFYTGGDGILTISYGELPDSDCFITSIDVKQQQGNYCDFSIMYKNSTSQFWKTLINIYWNENTSKWVVPSYRNGEIVYTSYDTIPLLSGKWVDGGLVIKGQTVADGYNFIVPRASKIKYQCNPKLKNVIMLTPLLGNDFSNLAVQTNKFIINIDCSSLKDDELAGSYFEISNDFSSEVGKIRYLIKSNNSSSITLENTLRDEDRLSKYRIFRSAYVSTCTKFEVYGYETTPSMLTITEDCSSLILQIPEAMHSSTVPSFPILVPDNPSKIISLGAGNVGSVRFLMTDVDSPENLSWKVRLNGNKYEIYGGDFFFDNSSRALIMPTSFVDQSGKDVISADLQYASIPTFLEMKYITGNGTEVKTKATSIGGGPSYLLEKDSIRFICGNEVSTDIYSQDIMEQIIKSGNSEEYTILPYMGSSIVFQHALNGSKNPHRIGMNWTVTNPSRCEGDFADLEFVGNELHGNKERDFNVLFNDGTGSEKENGFENSTHILGGKVETSVVLSGLPNTIISGNLYVYAKAVTQEKTMYRSPTGMQTVTTYERTGGIDKTGFMIGVKDMTDRVGVKKGRRGICCSKPEVYIYLRDRDSTEEIN